MPPEIVSGTDIQIDPRIDTWGVGVLIYYCLYLRCPFTGQDDDEIK